MRAHTCICKDTLPLINQSYNDAGLNFSSRSCLPHFLSTSTAVKATLTALYCVVFKLQVCVCVCEWIHNCVPVLCFSLLGFCMYTHNQCSFNYKFSCILRYRGKLCNRQHSFRNMGCCLSGVCTAYVSKHLVVVVMLLLRLLLKHI